MRLLSTTSNSLKIAGADLGQGQVKDHELVLHMLHCKLRDEVIPSLVAL